MSIKIHKAMILVVDVLDFRRAGIVCFLNSWATKESLELISAQSHKACEKLDVDYDCKMIVFSIGGSSVTSRENLKELRVLHALAPHAPLVVVADSEAPDEIVTAMDAGAQGYVNNAMLPDLALRAFSFILRGGAYFPSCAIRIGHFRNYTSSGGSPVGPAQLGSSPPSSRSRSADNSAENDNKQPPRGCPIHSPPARAIFPNGVKNTFASRHHHHPNGNGDGNGRTANGPALVAPAQGAEVRAPYLTERQQAVLQCLCQGDPNKTIGRKLHVTETSVKVHVREIMRKLGVMNRTQVVIYANSHSTATWQKPTEPNGIPDLSDAHPGSNLQH